MAQKNVKIRENRHKIRTKQGIRTQIRTRADLKWNSAHARRNPHGWQRSGGSPSQAPRFPQLPSDNERCPPRRNYTYSRNNGSHLNGATCKIIPSEWEKRTCSTLNFSTKLIPNIVSNVCSYINLVIVTPTQLYEIMKSFFLSNFSSSYTRSKILIKLWNILQSLSYNLFFVSFVYKQ